MNNVTMQLIIDNTCEPCNNCQKLQGYCECSCSFCKRHKRNVPDKVLIASERLIKGSYAKICKDCVRNAKEMIA